MRARVFVPALVLACFVGWWISPGRAFGATSSQCEAAWQFPNGKVADQCRAGGWIIRQRLDVNPRRVVIMADMPYCEVEDSPGLCLWDSLTQGDGHGNSFYRNRGDNDQAVHFVWTYDPTAGDYGWAWVSADGDRDLDKLRRHRQWTRCATYSGYLTCPWHTDPFPAVR